jgi:hypothetical protein
MPIPAATWLLGTRVRIPLGAWMFVLCFYAVLSCEGRDLCDELITRPKESYHVSKKNRETSKRRPWPDPGWSAIERGGGKRKPKL